MIEYVEKDLVAYNQDTDYQEWICDLAASCDGCGKDFDGGTFSEFDDLIHALKWKGWRFRQNDGVWLHFCPECAARYARPGAEEFSVLSASKEGEGRV